MTRHNMGLDNGVVRHTVFEKEVKLFESTRKDGLRRNEWSFLLKTDHFQDHSIGSEQGLE